MRPKNSPRWWTGSPAARGWGDRRQSPLPGRCGRPLLRSAEGLPARRERVRVGSCDRIAEAFSVPCNWTTFALAWYRLSLAAGWTRFAWRVRQRTGPSGTRTPRVQGAREPDGWRAQCGARSKSRNATTVPFWRYPDDVEAWFGLGVLRFHYAICVAADGERARAARTSVRLQSPEPGARLLNMSPHHRRLDGPTPAPVLLPLVKLRLARALCWAAAGSGASSRGSVQQATGSARRDPLARSLGELDAARQLAGPGGVTHPTCRRGAAILALSSWPAAGGPPRGHSSTPWPLIQPGSRVSRVLATPFLNPSRADLEALSDRLAGWGRMPSTESTSDFYVSAQRRTPAPTPVPARRAARALGDPEALALPMNSRGSTPTRGIAAVDLAQSVRAQVAWGQGAPEGPRELDKRRSRSLTC